jgi:hypothetical protein
VAKKKKPLLLLPRHPPLHPHLLLTLLLHPPHLLLHPLTQHLLPLHPPPRLLLPTRSNRFFDHAKATFGWLFSCLVPG